MVTRLNARHLYIILYCAEMSNLVLIDRHCLKFDISIRITKLKMYVVIYKTVKKLKKMLFCNDLKLWERKVLRNNKITCLTDLLVYKYATYWKRSSCIPTSCYVLRLYSIPTKRLYINGVRAIYEYTSHIGTYTYFYFSVSAT